MKLINTLSDALLKIVAPKVDANAVPICGCYNGRLLVYRNGNCVFYSSC